MNKPLMFINNNIIVEKLKTTVWEKYKEVASGDFKGWYEGLSPIEQTAWDVKDSEMNNTTPEKVIKESNYRPLPDCLYIGNSHIEGNGLFTREFIEKGRELGISHIKNDSGDFHSNFIRTPLAGFANHYPDNPNCKIYECGEYLKMKTILDIQEGDELTLNYTLYEPCKNYIDDRK